MNVILKSSRWLVYSGVLHVAIVGGLLWLSHQSLKQMGVDGGKSAVNSGGSDSQAGTAETLTEVHHFDGISYTQFSQAQEKAQAQKTASNLLGKLTGMTFGAPAAGKVEAPKMLRQPEITVKAPSETLTSIVKQQKITIQEPVATKKNATRKMSDRERAELRQQFRSLEGSLRKVYGHALTEDPHLSATVTFEAEIQPTGYLALSTFKVRGKYEQKSVDLFKSEMTNLLGRIFVAKDLSGALIRGETVFMR